MQRTAGGGNTQRSALSRKKTAMRNAIIDSENVLVLWQRLIFMNCRPSTAQHDAGSGGGNRGPRWGSPVGHRPSSCIALVSGGELRGTCLWKTPPRRALPHPPHDTARPPLSLPAQIRSGPPAGMRRASSARKKASMNPIANPAEDGSQGRSSKAHATHANPFSSGLLPGMTATLSEGKGKSGNET